jgi:hypothetical protein
MRSPTLVVSDELGGKVRGFAGGRKECVLKKAPDDSGAFG